MILYQYNEAWMREPWNAPVWTDFKSSLDRVHAAAERSTGFLGRFKGEKTGAGYIQPYPSTAPLIMGNLTYWKDLQSVKDFTFSDEHLDIMKKKRKWFKNPLTKPYNVLYFGDESLIDDLDEAIDRITYLRNIGNSDYAFDWRYT